MTDKADIRLNLEQARALVDDERRLHHTALLSCHKAEAQAHRARRDAMAEAVQRIDDALAMLEDL